MKFETRIVLGLALLFAPALPGSINAQIPRLIKLEKQNTTTFPNVTIRRGGTDIIDNGTSSKAVSL